MKSLLTAKGAISASLVLATTLLASSANAATTSKKAATSVASNATSDAATKKALPIGAAYTLDFYGTQIQDIASDETTNDAIDAKTALVLRHRPELNFKSGNTKISLIPDFNTQLTDPEANGSRGFAWNDSYIKINQANVMNTSISGNAVNLAAQVRIFVPSSKGSRDNKQIGSMQAYLNPTITFGKSKFSLEGYNFAQYYLQSEKFSPKSGSPLTQMRFYAGQQLNYAINDNITAYALYENIVRYNTLGIPQNTYSPNSSQADLEPGMSLQVSKAVNLSPYLNWYTNQSIKTTTVNLNANIQLM